MDALQTSHSYEKKCQDSFWSLNSNSFAICGGKHPPSFNAPDFGLGHMTCFGQKVRRYDISRYLKSAYTVKPALLYLCHCNDNMFWPVSGSMKNEIHMQSRADPDEPNIQLSNHSRVTKPSLN